MGPLEVVPYRNCLTEPVERDRLFLSNFKAAANRREMNWPDFYFNHRLLDWQPNK